MEEIVFILSRSFCPKGMDSQLGCIAFVGKWKHKMCPYSIADSHPAYYPVDSSLLGGKPGIVVLLCGLLTSTLQHLKSLYGNTASMADCQEETAYHHWYPSEWLHLHCLKCGVK